MWNLLTCFISLFVFVSHLGLLQDAINKDSFLKKELKREDVPHVNHRTVFNPAPDGGSRRRILTFNPIKKVAVSII